MNMLGTRCLHWFNQRESSRVRAQLTALVSILTLSFNLLIADVLLR